MKDSSMATPETTEEASSPTQNMQTELHSKGAVLTKAWSDLFSFITKYQCELTVKENAVEIAEREIEMRKKQLENMKPATDCGNEEIEKLQSEIQNNQSQLKLSKAELSAKEQMLRQLQSDLSCNMELLERSRSELLDKQTELVRNRSDLNRTKSELVVKQEQIQIKDNLLKKMQTQMMRENTELKEQLDLERRTLELECRAHDQTRRILSGCRGRSDKDAVRATAFTLFGNLSRFCDGPSKAPFLEQIPTNFISMLMHLNDRDTEVTKSCKYALRLLSPLIGSDDINSMFQKFLLDNAQLHYGKFMNDLSKVIIRDFPDKVNFYVMGSASFFKSLWPEIQSNAAMFVGFLLGNLPKDKYGNISKEHVCGASTILLKDESQSVRCKAAEAMSLLYDF